MSIRSIKHECSNQKVSEIPFSDQVKFGEFLRFRPCQPKIWFDEKIIDSDVKLCVKAKISASHISINVIGRFSYPITSTSVVSLILLLLRIHSKFQMETENGRLKN